MLEFAVISLSTALLAAGIRVRVETEAQLGLGGWCETHSEWSWSKWKMLKKCTAKTSDFDCEWDSEGNCDLNGYLTENNFCFRKYNTTNCAEVWPNTYTYKCVYE